MFLLFVLAVLTAALVAGFGFRLFQPHAGRHTAKWLASQPLAVVPPRVLHIGEWR